MFVAVCMLVLSLILKGAITGGRMWVAAGSPLHNFLSRPVLHKLSIDAQQEASLPQLLGGQGLKVAGVPLNRGGLDRGRAAQGLEAVCRQHSGGGCWGYRCLSRGGRPVHLQSPGKT